MKTLINIGSKRIKIDLSKPIDISIPFTTKPNSTKGWAVDPIKITSVVRGRWVGSVKDGGSVNFKNVRFNPHGNGTHTECVGHITREEISINKSLTNYFYIAQLLSVKPTNINGDQIITKKSLKKKMNQLTDAIIIRTLPNSSKKLEMDYTGKNPPYLEESAAQMLREKKVKHLLVDLPSVDKEQDQGKLLAHNAFWETHKSPKKNAFITELVYIPNEVKDGKYFLNIQVAPFEMDASPSRPLLFNIY